MVRADGERALPVIDIGAFLRPPKLPEGIVDVEAAKAETAARLRDACTDWGFFYVKNHGVEKSLVEGVHDMARRFFALPEEIKMRHQVRPEENIGRGYQPVGKNVTKGKPDMHEAIDLIREMDEANVAKSNLGRIVEEHPELAPLVHGRNYLPTNEEVQGFQEAYREYITEMLQLGQAVMRGMAVSLELEEDMFDRGLTDDSFWVMRVIGYPPAGSPGGVEGSVGCGEHTDYGCLTIVNQDQSHASLQVMDKRTGEFVWAEPVEGAFVMNIGDMFDVWTGGKYKSTLHRVIHQATTYRTSIPFFYEPNAGTEVQYILNDPALAHEKKVHYIDHLYSKIATNFDHTKGRYD